MLKIILFFILLNCFNLYSDEGADQTTSATKNYTAAENQLWKVNIAHAVLGTAGYSGMTANCIVGNIMLYTVYNNPEYDTITSASRNSNYKYLKYAHIGLTAGSYLFMGSSLIMGLTTMGLKIKKRIAINLPHFISAVITTFLFIIEALSAGIAAYAFNTKNTYAKEIGLTHGVFSYALLASYTVTLFTFPIKNAKVIFGNNF